MASHILHSSFRSLLLVILAQVLTSAVLYPIEGHPPPAIRLCAAASTVFVGFLLLPLKPSANRGARGLGITLAWSMAASVASLILMAVNHLASFVPTSALTSASGVFATLFLLAGVTNCLAALGFGVPRAHQLVLVALLLSSSAPLWLGPLAAAWPSGPDVTVKLCPLAYLAAMMEYDVLRSDWFYQHTPLGGMRFDYPGTFFGTTLFLGTGALGFFVSSCLSGRHVGIGGCGRAKLHLNPFKES